MSGEAMWQRDIFFLFSFHVGRRRHFILGWIKISWKRLHQVYLIIWQRILIIKRSLGVSYVACQALDRNQGVPHSKNTGIIQPLLLHRCIARNWWIFALFSYCIPNKSLYSDCSFNKDNVYALCNIRRTCIYTVREECAMQKKEKAAINSLAAVMTAPCHLSHAPIMSPGWSL